MRYIGPFFRMNSISAEEIKHQLFFFSKESLKNIVLNSKCGIVHYTKSNKKHSSNSDNNIFDKYSPLLCIYKKGNPKIVSKSNLSWDENTFKKEINVVSNALMTLSILELSDYYSLFKDVDKQLYELSEVYKKLAKYQLDFYSTSLRSPEGFFVDKKISSSNDNTFIDKKNKFKFSDQAFMMCAYYNYSNLSPSDDDAAVYKNFSLDILKMLSDFKEEIYSLSSQECNKLCLALNIFYDYSKEEKSKELVIDLMDLIKEKHTFNELSNEDIELTTLENINFYLTYKNTGYLDFKEDFMSFSKKHLELFDSDKSIFNKNSDKKDIKYSSTELLNYMFSSLIYFVDEDADSSYENNISSLYKRILLNGQLTTSWPDVPDIDSAERYRNASLRSEDMFNEQLFKISNIADSSDLCPVFRKEITYSKKKETITPSKDTFYAQRNMMIYFLAIYLFKKDIIQKTFDISEV